MDPIIASLLYIKILSYKILESQNWKTQPFLGPVARSQRLQPVAGGRLAAVLGVAPDHHAAVGENRREGPVGRLDLLHVLQQVLGKTPKKVGKPRVKHKTSGDFMGSMRRYDGIPSGKRLQFAIGNGHLELIHP